MFHDVAVQAVAIQAGDGAQRVRDGDNLGGAATGAWRLVPTAVPVLARMSPCYVKLIPAPVAGIAGR